MADQYREWSKAHPGWQTERRNRLYGDAIAERKRIKEEKEREKAEKRAAREEKRRNHTYESELTRWREIGKRYRERNGENRRFIQRASGSLSKAKKAGVGVDPFLESRAGLKAVAALLENATECDICRLPLDHAAKEGWGVPRIEHVIPRARGGRHELSNLQIAHDICNRLKSELTPEQFRAWIIHMYEILA